MEYPYVYEYKPLFKNGLALLQAAQRFLLNFNSFFGPHVQV